MSLCTRGFDTYPRQRNLSALAMGLPIHQSPAKPSQRAKLTAEELFALQQQLQEQQKVATKAAEPANGTNNEVSVTLHPIGHGLVGAGN